MRTRTVLAASAAAALTAVPVASAATAALTMNVPRNSGITAYGDVGGGTQGYVFYGTVFQQQFLVAVTDDAGQPVTGCLGTGGQVRLINSATGAQIGSPSTCAIGDGLFHIFPTKRISAPTDVVAVVDPSTLLSGAAVSSAQSNTATIRIAPKFFNRSPTINPGTVFPIRGQLDGGRFNKAGSLVLFKVQGSRKIRKQAKAIPASGRFEFRVRDTGRYRVEFIPKAGNGYVGSFMALTVTRR